MVPIDDAIAALSSLASQLNAETEDLNSTILDLDRQLAASQVGVTVWLKDEGDPIFAREDREKGDKGWILGYTKLDDGWRVAVQRVDLIWSHHPDDPTDAWLVRQPSADPIALAKAPRLVRVEAAGYFERLVNELSTKVKEFIENIEKAKSLVGKAKPTGSKSTGDSKLN